jgi:cbb3-type cytochrome oxidase subunit 3
MNQWVFVLAAYGVVALATVGLVAWAYWTMRKAEADAEAVKRRP